MKHIKTFVFFSLLAFYAIGILTGSMASVASENQEGMFNFLNSEISQYSASFSGSIKGVLVENLKLFIPIAIGCFFRISPIVLLGAVTLKGYSVGFSVTCALRFYGLSGLYLCVANFLSVIILLPSIAYFGALAVYGKFGEFKKYFLRKYFMYVVILLVIFLLDSLLRGALSCLLMKYSGFLIKTS